ncbi:MAG: tetratricopeptide repeat protein [Tannerellaceae bacterium]|nr:tetratricopeptide repeat protein [Tannerellaceae bacterium]
MKHTLLLIFIFCISAYTGTAQTYEEFISKSYDYLEQEDYLSAEESLRAALRLEPANPHNYALLTNLGTIQRRQGKKEEAILSYTAALSRQTSNVMILENRASLYAEMGETEKAINDYTTLLLTDPIHEEALYARGLLFLQSRNFLWAEQDFDRLLEINEKSVRARVCHAVLEKMRENYEESERIYNYLISERPHDWSLYEGRADLYFMMNKNGRAMADLNRVFAETTPTAALYVLRAKVKLAQYEREAAIKDLKQAEEMGYDQEIIDELMRLAK